MPDSARALLLFTAMVSARARAQVEDTAQPVPPLATSTTEPAESPIPPPPVESTRPEASDAELVEVDGLLLERVPRVQTRAEAEAADDARLAAEELAIPEPPPPPWRLRVGAGVGLPVAGATQPLLLVTEELELQLADTAPFMFGLGATQVVGATFAMSAGGRVGGVATILEQEDLILQGVVVAQVGAFFDDRNLAFEVGGEAGVRLRLGAFEAFAQVGFGGTGVLQFLSVEGGVGVAF